MKQMKPLLAAAGLLISLTLSSCAWSKRIGRNERSDPREAVAATVPGNPTEVRDQLLRLPGADHAFQQTFDGFPELGVFLRAKWDDPIFPDDGAILVNLDRAPWMQAYLDIPASRRLDDLYFYSVMDVFWPSEYTFEEAPAEFYSDFIVHLEAEGEGAARVEVFEYLPRIRVGKSLQLGAHGPCMCWDMRWVDQTRRDRIALLSQVEGMIRAGHPADGDAPSTAFDRIHDRKPF